MLRQSLRAALRQRIGFPLVTFWLGSFALAGPVAAADMVPQAVFFYKLGTGTTDGPLVVTLNSQGVWAHSEETEQPWSLAYRVEWATGIGMVKDFRVFAKPGWGPGSQSGGLGSQAEVNYADLPNVAKALIEQGKIAKLETTAAVSAVFPYSGSSSTPAGVCQLKRNELLASGTSLHDILANDWIVEKEAKAIAVLDYYKDYTLNQYGAAVGEDPDQVSAVVTLPLTVFCKGDPTIADAVAPLYQGSYATGFQVTGAKLFIAPAYQNLTADCPVTVPLVAEFTASNAGGLKFRFVSASGKVSQLRSVSITGQTGGVYKALYEEHMQVPLTQATGTGGGQGGGGIVNQQAGGGLAVQTQPEEPLFPTTPSNGGMGQVQVNPLSGNIHSESFRVEVVQPTTGVVSAYAGYRITCKPTMAPGIAGAQNLQMQPTPPQPGSDGATTVIGGVGTPPAPPTPRQMQVQAAPQLGGLTSGLKPDIMGTTLGFLLGGNNPWGSTIVIDKPPLAAATGVGAGKNLCRFAQAGYRPFNKGDVATGPFKNRVYRGSQTVNQSLHNLGPKQTDGWHVFPLELPSGLSVIRVVMDADKQVDESDEDNTFSVRVNVLLDCGGQTRLRVAPDQPQPAPPQRVAPLQPRLPQRQ